jgi:membrane fusion protein, multidrug efflux system
MSKNSLIIPLVAMLAAADLLFGIARHLAESQGNQPGQKTDGVYLDCGRDSGPLSRFIPGRREDNQAVINDRS